METKATSKPPLWVHLLAVAGAAFTWPLLLVGGTVSIYRVGMAVPDWPTTFQSNMFLYNMFEAPFGPFAEHAHRLYGAAVGFVCIALAGIFTFARIGARGLVPFAAVVAATVVAVLNPSGIAVLGLSKVMAAFLTVSLVSLGYAVVSWLTRRDGVVALSWFLIAAVCGQGVLGGIRVNQNSTFLAFVHGFTAQLFFGLMAVMVVITGRRWSEALEPGPGTARQFRNGLVTTFLILIQILAGAYVRHYKSSGGLMIHFGLAIAVVGHIIPLALRTWRQGTGVPLLRASSGWMLLFSALQIVLGVIAWWILRPFDGIDRAVSPLQATIRVAHQGAGALVLASSVAFTLLAARRLWSGPRDQRTVSEHQVEGHPVEMLA